MVKLEEYIGSEYSLPGGAVGCKAGYATGHNDSSQQASTTLRSPPWRSRLSDPILPACRVGWFMADGNGVGLR